jgi:arsenate reductase
MADAVIYYNPKCQTCRSALEIMRQAGLQPRVVEYLKTPPSEQELDDILKKLGTGPEAIVRQKEPVYEQKAAGKTLSRGQWLKLLHENPILIQRPIVIYKNRAIVARPPEKVKEIL